MTDLLLVGILVVFFAIAVAFVKGCEWIIGPDTALPAADDDATAEAAVS